MKIEPLAAFRTTAYSLESGEGWSCSCCIPFTIKPGELQPRLGAAFAEDAPCLQRLTKK